MIVYDRRRTDRPADDSRLRRFVKDRVVSVAMQSEDVARHMRTRGLSFPTIDDPEGMIASAWKVNGVPAHFVIDGAGKVRFRTIGYATEWGLRARLWWAENFS